METTTINPNYSPRIHNDDEEDVSFEICEELIPANPTVWSAEVRSANGSIDAVNVTASMMVNSPIGTQFTVSGGGELWTKSISLTVIYKTENVVVCEETCHYSDANGRRERSVAVKLFQI
jgi:hypothetical protein